MDRGPGIAEQPHRRHGTSASARGAAPDPYSVDADTVLNKWLRLGLPTHQHTETLEVAWALSFLPGEAWGNGTQNCGMAVSRRCADAEELPNVTFFVNYIIWQWLPLKNIVSSYGRFVKTTNVIETYHVFANKEYGPHPPIFEFLSSTEEVMEIMMLKYASVRRRNVVPNTRSMNQMQEDKALLAQQNRLKLGRISISDYMLFCVSQRRLQHFPGKVEEQCSTGNSCLYQSHIQTHLRSANRNFNIANAGELPTAEELAAEASFARDIQDVFRRNNDHQGGVFEDIVPMNARQARERRPIGLLHIEAMPELEEEADLEDEAQQQGQAQFPARQPHNMISVPRRGRGRRENQARRPRGRPRRVYAERGVDDPEIAVGVQNVGVGIRNELDQPRLFEPENDHLADDFFDEDLEMDENPVNNLTPPISRSVSPIMLADPVDDSSGDEAMELDGQDGNEAARADLGLPAGGSPLIDSPPPRSRSVLLIVLHEPIDGGVADSSADEGMEVGQESHTDDNEQSSEEEQALPPIPEHAIHRRSRSGEKRLRRSIDELRPVSPDLVIMNVQEPSVPEPRVPEQSAPEPAVSEPSVSAPVVPEISGPEPTAPSNQRGSDRPSSTTQNESFANVHHILAQKRKRHRRRFPTTTTAKGKRRCKTASKKLKKRLQESKDVVATLRAQVAAMNVERESQGNGIYN
ncbi:hypothetical protein QAD02_012813 [Eretmocerus hayati]|uniref:Uncharacterized protein n=1 Tax=Eretmocerus hayati TaxID=131215 RepID=A0ACC2P1T5_9HYME|nr:hypothetical protein QAD02_012813 [Eretmocerus hayati]